MICEVDARLACLEKERVKNWPEMQKNCILLQGLLSVLDKTSLVCLSVCLLSRVLERFLARRPGSRIAEAFSKCCRMKSHQATPSWEMSLIVSLSSSLPSLHPRLWAGGSERVLRAAQKAAGGGREARADSGAQAGDDGSVRESDGAQPPRGAQQVKLFPQAPRGFALSKQSSLL